MTTNRPAQPTSPGPPSRTGTKPSGWQWPALVVGLLLLNVCVCTITIVAAATTKPEVEKDYYQKALEWDEYRAAEAARSARRAGPRE